MKIHFIAIGGAVMHNLAIALHLKGYQVTGSDDEIFDPSRSRLEKYGLLPDAWGWFDEKICPDLDAVILGMHARADNPELLKAKKLGLKIFSFPEYLYEQTKDKKRVVIAGSHGKTTITSMILHAMKKAGAGFDYMVGSQIPGFETMVGLAQNSEIAVFEGDEYLSSPLDTRPKFAHYKPFITLISGIAWDHMNVYPEYEGYVKEFLKLAQDTDSRGSVFYFSGDNELNSLMNESNINADTEGYTSLPYEHTENGTRIFLDNSYYPVNLIGRYNMENLTGAMLVCEKLGMERHDFLNAMSDFQGAARRQELIFESEDLKIFRDFAHAPSKVQATIDGFREFYPDEKITAFLELHTFSSLNQDFLPQYKDSLDKADHAFIYFDPEVVRHKKLPELDPGFVKKCFGNPEITILNSPVSLETRVREARQGKGILLLMSSGNFGGIKI